MKRRLVLLVAAAAVLTGGATAASAGQRAGAIETRERQHQLCVILYDTRGGPSTPICLNW